jgi:hypothetical protein
MGKYKRMLNGGIKIHFNEIGYGHVKWCCPVLDTQCWTVTHLPASSKERLFSMIVRYNVFQLFSVFSYLYLVHRL